MASSTFKQLNVVYPARKHAAKVYTQLLKSAGSSKGWSTKPPALYLQGHGTSVRDDSDRELPFRQESNFVYLTGASQIRDASVLVSLSPKASSSVSESAITSVLFLPPVDPADVMWSGLPLTPEQVHDELSYLSKVEYRDQLEGHLKALPSGTEILTLPLTPNPSSLPSTVSSTPSQDLLSAFHEARTTKTPEEIVIMRHANAISSEAHESVMKALAEARDGKAAIKTEAEAEAVWLAGVKMHNAKNLAYESIFAYGPHAGTLHYVANSAPFTSLPDGALLLVDAGCEVDCYTSDITRTAPTGNSGKFTKEGKGVYEVVLKMQDEALAMIKAGVDWEDIQLKMHLVAAQGLLKLGILKGATAEELVAKKAVTPFFPHGVGHFLGLDTHDVGGLPNGRSTDPNIRYLRLRRHLEVGNVVTVEPGLYFNDFLLEPCKNSEYIDHEVLRTYMPVGGVRIEDNVVVTEDGYDNLTTAAKTVEDVEKLCGGSK